MNIKKIKEDTNNDVSIFYYKNNFLEKHDYNDILKKLENTTDWKVGVTYNGLNIKRKQKWFHINNKYFCNNWKNKYDRWKSHNYNDTYYNIQNIIQKYIEKILKKDNVEVPNINSILINYYENGDNQIGFHKDNKLSFGENPTIIILSIGDKRIIRFERTIPDKIIRDKKNKHLNFEVELENNSIFIMSGKSQKYWVHSIIKEKNKKERYSLTFREHIL